jgi:hypothetical protein
MAATAGSGLGSGGGGEVRGSAASAAQERLHIMDTHLLYMHASMLVPVEVEASEKRAVHRYLSLTIRLTTETIY